MNMKPYLRLPGNAGQPILDWVTLIIEVEEIGLDNPWAASDLVEAAFGVADFRCDKKTGEVKRSTSSHVLKHPETNGVLTIRALTGNRIMMKGNPMTWLFGQNAYCCYEPGQVLNNVMLSWYEELLDNLDLDTRRKFKFKSQHFSTLHLAMMFAADSNLQARQMLSDLQTTGTCGRLSKQIIENGVYFGKSSKHYAVKVYVDDRKQCTSAPQGISGRCLRVELVLHDDMITKHFGDPNGDQMGQFRDTDLRDVFSAETENLQTNAANTTKALIRPDLTDAQLGVYVRWFHGCLDRSREKLRYHRDAIMRIVGVDITVPHNPSDNVDAFANTDLQSWMTSHNITNRYGVPD